MSAPNIPAGWYPNGDDPSTVRWWDGQGWTDQTAETPSAGTHQRPTAARRHRFRGVAEAALVTVLFIVAFSLVANGRPVAVSAIPERAAPVPPVATRTTPAASPATPIWTPTPTVTETPAPSPTPSSTCEAMVPNPAGAGVPDVRGLILTEAKDVLSKAGVATEQGDLSPLDRSVWDADNWTVVATTLDGEKVVMWYLRTSEAAWFRTNPAMPEIKAGTKTETLTEDGGVLNGVDELVVYRWAKGETPPWDKDSDPYISDDDRVGLSDEPEQEVKDRTGLKESGGRDLVHSTRPATGDCVRPGRYLVILEKQSKDTKAEVKDYNKPYDSKAPGKGDDDDDGNIPGWLCPTRFC